MYLLTSLLHSNISANKQDVEKSHRINFQIRNKSVKGLAMNANFDDFQELAVLSVKHPHNAESFFDNVC